MPRDQPRDRQTQMLIASAASRILWELHGRLAAPHPDFNRTQIELVGKAHSKPHDIAIEAPQRRLGCEPEFQSCSGNRLPSAVKGWHPRAPPASGALPAR